MFWLPVLGLYTGCRIEELCQLHCDDLIQIEGIWCLDINDDGDKRLKNSPSKRIVPLHPVLVDVLNFPGYVEKLKEKGETRIFPELKKISHQYSHAASRWFNGRYKKQIGLIIKEGEKKTYHSFRHTLSDHLKQKLVSGTIIDELPGHAVEGESMGRYGKPYVSKTLYEKAVLKLDYGIDLSHLKKSKWVPK
jgi:integrase